jgi:hypothetical protein
LECFGDNKKVKLKMASQNMQSDLDQLGLPYVIDTITMGDGNCFFRALIQQLDHFRANSFGSHGNLRQALIDFVCTNESLQDNEVFLAAKENYVQNRKTEDESNSEAWIRLAGEMLIDGKWADDIFILCASVFLGRYIYITSNQQSITHPWARFDCGIRNGAQPITLYSVVNQHFQSIVPAPASLRYGSRI